MVTVYPQSQREVAMNPLANVSRRVVAATALASVAILLPAAALAAPARTTAPAQTASPARTAAASTPRPCRVTGLQIWLGLGEGGGAAGSVTYPLEFSNTGTQSCRVSGFVKIVALSRNGHQLGKSSSHSGKSRRVILQPGGTAHALLTIVENQAFTNCHPATARSLEITAPRDRIPFSIESFSFPACNNKKVGLLEIRPVRPGTGIPGFTTR
jgi:Protein of unknown function (DUF4232)